MKFLTKKELLNKLRRLQKGFPTDLIYINRKIDNICVQVPNEYDVQTIDEFLERDIQTVFSLNCSIIRPILGMFGSGKSTILNRIDQNLPFIISIDKYLLIRINFDNISIIQHDEFIKVLMKQIFPTLEKSLFKTMFEETAEEELIDIFQGVEITRNIKKLHSSSGIDRIKAKEYFLDEIGEDKIFQVVEGMIKLSKKYGNIVIILLDELEILIKLDTEGILTEILVSRFLRGILDRHDTSVYIVFTCYIEAYEVLEKKFYRFYRIVEGLEIKLGDLSNGEKKELTQMILDETMEYTFGKLHLDEVMEKLKGRIDFYMDKAVKLITQEVLRYIDQFQEISKQIQTLYENNARQDVAVKELIKTGFKRENIWNEPVEIGGYNFDIFASEDDRGEIVKRAFGEIKSVHCNKGWAEDFTVWLKMQIYTKSNGYIKERDTLLFVAPSYTKDAKDLLEENGVKCLIHIDPAIEKIKQKIEDKKVEGLTEEEKEIIAYINDTANKSRVLGVKFRKKFPNILDDILEGLLKKNKIEIKTKSGKNHVQLKK